MMNRIVAASLVALVLTATSVGATTPPPPPANANEGYGAVRAISAWGTYMCINKDMNELGLDAKITLENITEPMKGYFGKAWSIRTAEEAQWALYNSAQEWLGCHVNSRASAYFSTHLKSNMPLADGAFDAVTTVDGLYSKVTDAKMKLDLILLGSRWAWLKVRGDGQKPPEIPSASSPSTGAETGKQGGSIASAANTAISNVVTELTNKVTQNIRNTTTHNNQDQSITNNNQDQSTTNNNQDQSDRSVNNNQDQSTTDNSQNNSNNSVRNEHTNSNHTQNNTASTDSHDTSTNITDNSSTTVQNSSPTIVGGLLQTVKSTAANVGGAVIRGKGRNDCARTNSTPGEVTGAVFVGEVCGSKFYAKLANNPEAGFFYGMTDANHPDARIACPASYRLPTHDELKKLSKSALASLMSSDHRYWTQSPTFTGKQWAFKTAGQELVFGKVKTDGSFAAHALCVTTI